MRRIALFLAVVWAVLATTAAIVMHERLADAAGCRCAADRSKP